MESTQKGGAPAAAGADAVETASITHLPTMELPYFDSVEGVDLHTVFHEHSGCFVSVTFCYSVCMHLLQFTIHGVFDLHFCCVT